MTIARRWSGQDTYAGLIETAAATYAIPRHVAYGLVAQESGFNARALGDGGRSFGLVQIQLTTAQGLGYRGDGPGLFDPSTNTQLGMRYLREQVNRAGSVEGGLSAYNGGYGRPGYGIPRADGTYANQAYVTGVLDKAGYFATYLADRDGAAPPGPIVDAGAPPSGVLGWLLSLGVIGALVARFRQRKRAR